MTTPGWRAPMALSPIDAVVSVPRSKSITNRAVLLAALATGRSRVSHPLRARDTDLMVAALRQLGVAIADEADSLVIDGGLDITTGSSITIDVGNAGTVLRFLPPVAALSARAVTFDGDVAVRARPISALLDALRDLGVGVAGEGTPFTIDGSGVVAGGDVTIDASSSSQLVSALMLAGAAFTNGVRIKHQGPRAVPNAPHLAMSATMLRDRGVQVETGGDEWRVMPGPILARDEVVEPDLSSAAPFVAAAVATRGRVTVTDWPSSTTQPGGMLPDILRAFGATVTLDASGLTVEGGDVITGVDLDLRNGGELTPVIAALACLASTPSRLLGVDYLRGHETDRLAALTTELGALGAEVTEVDDGLTIVPKPLHSNGFSSYDDHRIAMAGAVAGLTVDGVVIDNIATTAKTFPGFETAWQDFVTGSEH